MLPRVGLFRREDLTRQTHQLEKNVHDVLHQWDKLTPIHGSVFNLRGRSHVVTAAHVDGYLRVDHPTACELVIPPESIHGFKVGACLTGIQVGAGALTVKRHSPATTLLGPGGTAASFTLSERGVTFSLTYVGDEDWDFSGAT